MRLCRADKLLLGGGAAVIGSAALFGATPLAVGAPAALLAAAITDGVFRPSSSTFYPTVSHGPRHRPFVALTFDDGPHPETTPRILDALAEARAKATFFVIGRHLETRRSIAERAAAEGHELGNHSWTHSYLQNFFSARRHAQEIERNARLIQQITGSEATPLFRAPVGLKSPPLARAAHALQLKVIAWSLHTRDTFSRDPQAVAARTLARIRPGDIVLMHDGHERADGKRFATAEALPIVLEGLRAKGLQSVSVSELLGSG